MQWRYARIWLVVQNMAKLPSVINVSVIINTFGDISTLLQIGHLSQIEGLSTPACLLIAWNPVIINKIGPLIFLDLLHTFTTYFT